MELLKKNIHTERIKSKALLQIPLETDINVSDAKPDVAKVIYDCGTVKIDEIKTGMNKTDGKYIEIPDRREAIRWCIENAQDGDIIVLAGKGSEDYQEIKGVRYPFDERVVIREILEDLK